MRPPAHSNAIMVRNLSGRHQPNAGMRSADIWIRKQTSTAQSHSTLSTQVSHWYDQRSRHSARNSTTESHSKPDTNVLNDERFSSSTELPNRLVSLYTVLNLYQPTAIVPTFSIRIMFPRNTTTGQRLPKEIYELYSTRIEKLLNFVERDDLWWRHSSIYDDEYRDTKTYLTHAARGQRTRAPK